MSNRFEVDTLRFLCETSRPEFAEGPGGPNVANLSQDTHLETSGFSSSSLSSSVNMFLGVIFKQGPQS